MGWQEYFDELHNRSNPNWGNNPMGPIMENLSPDTSSEYLTLPETGAKTGGSTSGVEADTEEVEDPLHCRTSLTVPPKRLKDTP